MRATASWTLVLAGALQSPLVMRHPRVASVGAQMMAAPDGSDRAMRIRTLEEYIEKLDTRSDDPKSFAEIVNQLTLLKKEGLAVGSSEYARVVVEAEQAVEMFRWAYQQEASQRGDANPEI